MKVIVFGATGYLGEHIVAQLVSENQDEVTVSVRSTSKQRFDNPQVRVIEGDLRNADYVAEAVRGMDAVIFSAGLNWRPGIPNEQFQRGNAEITKNLFAALQHFPPIRLVYTSSMASVGGSSTPVVFSEDSGRGFVCKDRLNPYSIAKLECDRLADEFAEGGGNIAILHPGFILGPGVREDSSLSTCFFVEDFCNRAYPFYPNGGHSYCDVRDVAAAHVNAIRRDNRGEHYIVAGYNYRFSEVYALLAGLTGIANPIRIPLGVAYTATMLNDFAAAATGGWIKSPVHRDFVKSMGLYFFANSEKARVNLAYENRSFHTTLIDTLRCLQSHETIPEELEFVKVVTVDNVESILCLKQLAEKHVFKKFLLPRLSRIYCICQENRDLDNALQSILKVSKFDGGTGKFNVARRSCKSELRVIHRMFEYLYFGSDEFLAEMIPS